jgi:hypothetical protein
MRDKTFGTYLYLREDGTLYAYTYLWLREDGTPYYVGKGKGKRAYRKGCPPHDRILVQLHPSERDAFAAESFLIAYYGRIDQGTGCLRNRTDGGDNPPSQKGVPKSVEHRRKIGDAHRGKRRLPFSTEWRSKLSEAAKTSQRGNQHNLGHTLSQETRKKLSDSKKGKKKSPEHVAKMLAGICAKGGLTASHLRWHIRRGITNPSCVLCQGITDILYRRNWAHVPVEGNLCQSIM